MRLAHADVLWRRSTMAGPYYGRGGLLCRLLCQPSLTKIGFVSQFASEWPIRQITVPSLNVRWCGKSESLFA